MKPKADKENKDPRQHPSQQRRENFTIGKKTVEIPKTVERLQGISLFTGTSQAKKRGRDCSPTGNLNPDSSRKTKRPRILSTPLERGCAMAKDSNATRSPRTGTHRDKGNALGLRGQDCSPLPRPQELAAPLSREFQHKVEDVLAQLEDPSENESAGERLLALSELPDFYGVFGFTGSGLGNDANREGGLNAIIKACRSSTPFSVHTAMELIDKIFCKQQGVMPGSKKHERMIKKCAEALIHVASYSSTPTSQAKLACRHLVRYMKMNTYGPVIREGLREKRKEHLYMNLMSAAVQNGPNAYLTRSLLKVILTSVEAPENPAAISQWYFKYDLRVGFKQLLSTQADELFVACKEKLF